MQRKVAFLHTVPALASTFSELAAQSFPPGFEVFNIVDEMLLKTVLAQGGLSPFIHRRVAEHAFAVETGGANLLMITCSSIAPCVESARPMVSIPVLRVDEPMVEEAIAAGTVIGLCATAPTTIKPTTELILTCARAMNKKVRVEPALCEAASKAIYSGDTHTHDTLLRGTLIDLAQRCDVIVLAQVSMARILDSLDPTELKVPILASPKQALARVLELLAQ